MARLSHIVFSALFKNGSEVPVEEFVPLTPYEIATGGRGGHGEQTPDDHAKVIEAMFGHLRSKTEEE